MNVFGWLLLGHLLGDWLLQNDWMARGKRRALFTWPGMTHFATYTATVLTTLYLFCGRDTELSVSLTTGALVFVSHWLIDATNLVQCWMRFYGQSDREVVRVMVDQTLHILTLGLLTIFPLFSS